ncbi:hypothetical protein [Catenuloplanes japonicus]|uniref:hypothetical protein n=1 Tax=Catenuloplanes japonicus TaxID=33876 RepID=UPI0005275104|nr:hypothetical protein [Catenuloplanes japonicus]
MRLGKQMRARRSSELAALRAEVAALRAEVAALRPSPPPPADDLAQDYRTWRDGPLLRLAKVLTRRAGSDAPAPARGAAMHALCRVLLTPATDAETRHRLVGDTVTDLLGDTSWRNDAALVRTLIEARDGATPLRDAVAVHEWLWPAGGVALDPARHDILPGSEGGRVVATAAPGLRGAVLPLVVAG